LYPIECTKEKSRQPSRSWTAPTFKEHKCKVSPSAATINWSRPGSREYCRPSGGLLFPPESRCESGISWRGLHESALLLRSGTLSPRERVPRKIFCAIASGEGDSVTQAMGIVISIPSVKSQGKASKSRNLFVPPCYVHRDRAMLGFVDARSSLTHPFPFPRGRGQGMEFGPTPFASISRTMFDRPATATKVKHRDRAMLGFVDSRSSLTHPFPFPRGRGRPVRQS
jgi:hypothetical protein